MPASAGSPAKRTQLASTVALTGAPPRLPFGRVGSSLLAQRLVDVRHAVAPPPGGGSMQPAVAHPPQGDDLQPTAAPPPQGDDLQPAAALPPPSDDLRPTAAFPPQGDDSRLAAALPPQGDDTQPTAALPPQGDGLQLAAAPLPQGDATRLTAALPPRGDDSAGNRSEPMARCSDSQCHQAHPSGELLPPLGGCAVRQVPSGRSAHSWRGPPLLFGGLAVWAFPPFLGAPSFCTTHSAPSRPTLAVAGRARCRLARLLRASPMASSLPLVGPGICAGSSLPLFGARDPRAGCA